MVFISGCQASPLGMLQVANFTSVTSRTPVRAFEPRDCKVGFPPLRTVGPCHLIGPGPHGRSSHARTDATPWIPAFAGKTRGWALSVRHPGEGRDPATRPPRQCPPIVKHRPARSPALIKPKAFPRAAPLDGLNTRPLGALDLPKRSRERSQAHVRFRPIADISRLVTTLRYEALPLQGTRVQCSTNASGVWWAVQRACSFDSGPCFRFSHSSSAECFLLVVMILEQEETAPSSLPFFSEFLFSW